MSDNEPELFISRVRRMILEMGTCDWIEVYHRNSSSDFSVVIAAFVKASTIPHILRSDSWGVKPTDLVPGCSRYSNGSIDYYPHGNPEGHQPLVLERRFHGIKPDYEEISEEFRLFHNLYFDSKSNKYIKIKQDGSEQDVIRIAEDGSIKVRSVEIKQFLSVKEMCLGLFFDIRQS